MKYAIESLFNNTNVLCHETRVTSQNAENWVLHFLICQDSKDTLPYFTMGYEYYTDTADMAKPLVRSTNNSLTSYLEGDHIKEKTDYGYIHSYGLLSATDTEQDLFTPNAALRSGFPTSDTLATHTTYSKPYSDEVKTQEKDKTHSIWHSDIHLSKERKVNNADFSFLLNKYKHYIAKEITPKLNRESDFNIDMEKIFGISFDWERVKTDMWGKDDKSTTRESKDMVS